MAITTTSADYLLDLSNGLSASVYTTPNEIKTFTLDGLILDQYPTAMGLSGTILNLTLADGTVLPTELSSLTGTATSTTLSSVSWAADVLTVSMTDGASDTTAIVLEDTSVDSFVFEDTNNTLTLTQDNLGAGFVVDLSPLANEWDSVGSALDVDGTFNIKYTTAAFEISSANGNVSMLLDMSAATKPATLSLPPLIDTPMGWECSILTYDSAGTAGTIVMDVSGSVQGMLQDQVDPTPLTSPYPLLTGAQTIEPGHFYRIKKISSEFYIIHYS
jgi:hypothetical protein